MNRPQPPDAQAPDGDPWAAFGYLVAGVLFYGLLGWGLSVWLHASYWIPIGILVGAGFGIYLVFARFSLRGPARTDSSKAPDEGTADKQRPSDDNGGDTA